jgi:hypothetical protein
LSQRTLYCFSSSWMSKALQYRCTHYYWSCYSHIIGTLFVDTGIFYLKSHFVRCKFLIDSLIVKYFYVEINILYHVYVSWSNGPIVLTILLNNTWSSQTILDIISIVRLVYFNFCYFRTTMCSCWPG